MIHVIDCTWAVRGFNVVAAQCIFLLYGTGRTNATVPVASRCKLMHLKTYINGLWVSNLEVIKVR